MAHRFNSLADAHNPGFDEVIDVRSPSEYAEDHIPGAINLPALDDGERARVGTIYTQTDPFTAKKIGAALVARNAATHLEGPLKDRGGAWRPLVYCWRGGQRSGSFTSILKQIGWRADTLEGGYQSYRRLVAGVLHVNPLAHRFLILEGNTGTAKTELLHILSGRGYPILDLEGLARHRGSVFGAMGYPQPRQKMFESQLAQLLQSHPVDLPILVEAESSKIGRLIVPPSLWEAMKTAPRIRLVADLDARADYLCRTYTDIVSDTALIDDRLNALIPHQGRERVAQWQGLLAHGKLVQLARELMQDHYDPSYRRSGASHAKNLRAELKIATLSPAGLETAASQLEKLITHLPGG